MNEHIHYDPFAGTTYRHLLNAADAVDSARFHGSTEDGIGYDHRAAITAIDQAIAELASARSLLAEVTA